MDGSSAYFRGGIVAYSNAVKTQVLGVDASIIEQYGAVSEPCVIKMAQGAQQIMHTDFAIATSGIAGTSGGTPDKPVGTVYIGIATPCKVYAQRFDFGDRGRQQVMERTVANALNMLIKNIDNC